MNRTGLSRLSSSMLLKTSYNRLATVKNRRTYCALVWPNTTTTSYNNKLKVAISRRRPSRCKHLLPPSMEPLRHQLCLQHQSLKQVNRCNRSSKCLKTWTNKYKQPTLSCNKIKWWKQNRDTSPRLRISNYRLPTKSSLMTCLTKFYNARDHAMATLPRVKTLEWTLRLTYSNLIFKNALNRHKRQLRRSHGQSRLRLVQL